jgi:hypothetical protein
MITNQIKLNDKPFCFTIIVYDRKKMLQIDYKLGCMSTGHNLLLEKCISRNEPFFAIKVIYCGVGGSCASDRIKLSLSVGSVVTGF